MLYAFHLCAALIGGPLGGATSLVRENGAACTHFLISCLFSPLNIILHPLRRWFCVTLGRSKRTHTHAGARAHAHTGRHGFHISVLQGSYCFTGNHVTGQMIELLMGVQCNNNRPLVFCDSAVIFTAATQPNLRRPCYDPNPITPTLQNNTDAPPPTTSTNTTTLLFCFYSQTAFFFFSVCSLRSGEHYRVCRTISTAVPGFQGRGNTFSSKTVMVK